VRRDNPGVKVALVNKRTKLRTLRGMQDPKREDASPPPGRESPSWPGGGAVPAPNGNGDGLTVDGALVDSGIGAPARNPRRIPEATVARLPVYLRSLLEMAEDHTVTISSERLAEMAGVNAAKVRKDLSYLGSYGTRGVGYDVQFLLVQINRVLGLTQDWPVVIVGIGNLGHALANYRGFSARGFRIAALVDADRAKVGEIVADLPVRHLDELPAIAAEQAIAIGIVATPASSAQEVADQLVAAGVTSILNFAPAVISVPRGVSLRKVDLSIELQILSFYQQLRDVAPRMAEA
jgi:redox-sensing transcriptional repressor